MTSASLPSVYSTSADRLKESQTLQTESRNTSRVLSLLICSLGRYAARSILLAMLGDRHAGIAETDAELDGGRCWLRSLGRNVSKRQASSGGVGNTRLRFGLRCRATSSAQPDCGRNAGVIWMLVVECCDAMRCDAMVEYTGGGWINAALGRNGSLRLACPSTLASPGELLPLT